MVVSACRRSHATEIVWDAGATGTAMSAAGTSLEIGQPDGWTPESLLALTAASTFMTAFIERAAAVGIEILGYVSAAHLESAPDQKRPTIRLAPCIVIPPTEDPASVRALCDTVLAESPIARVLEPHLVIDIGIQTLPVLVTSGG
jgi:organic hydroperoxide reductase OsmC/OhrA